MPVTAAHLKQRLAELLEVPKKEADDILWALEEVAIETVKNADSMILPGIGKLECKVQEARDARNPRTGEKVRVPAKITVKFKVGKPLKEQTPSIKAGRALLEKREAQKKKSKRGAHLRKPGKVGRPRQSSKKRF